MTIHDNNIMSNLANLQVHFLMGSGLMDAGQPLKESLEVAVIAKHHEMCASTLTHILQNKSLKDKAETQDSSVALRRLLSGPKLQPCNKDIC